MFCCCCRSKNRLKCEMVLWQRSSNAGSITRAWFYDQFVCDLLEVQMGWKKYGSMKPSVHWHRYQQSKYSGGIKYQIFRRISNITYRFKTFHISKHTACASAKTSVNYCASTHLITVEMHSQTQISLLFSLPQFISSQSPIRSQTTNIQPYCLLCKACDAEK